MHKTEVLRSCIVRSRASLETFRFEATEPKIANLFELETTPNDSRFGIVEGSV